VSNTKTLGELQEEYALALARLVVWVFEQGWRCRMGEGFVGDTDAKDGDHDGPHRKDGGHYKKLATDLVLTVNGKVITDGTHPAWAQLHRKWQSLHPLAGTIAHDMNHIGFRHGGVL
jgi:hypothetical protein